MEFHQHLSAAVTQRYGAFGSKVTKVEPDVAVPDTHVHLLAGPHLAVLELEAVDLVGDGDGGRQVQLQPRLQACTPYILYNSRQRWRSSKLQVTVILINFILVI